MPRYDYQCNYCDEVHEISHSMNDDSEYLCSGCDSVMEKLLSANFEIAIGLKGTLADGREKDHTKKVKDPERAFRMRKKLLGSSEVGNPVSASDPKHIIKRGRTLGGQQKEVDKKEFIKAAARDKMMVNAAKTALQKRK